MLLLGKKAPAGVGGTETAGGGADNEGGRRVRIGPVE